MLKKHFFDPDFKFASKELIKFLSVSKFNNYNCLDIPSGNGRNIYLLSKYFNKVIGVDINKTYLDEIELNKGKYKSKNISTIQNDILEEISLDFKQFDFICISHFYNRLFFNYLETKINSGVILYIETPTCRGCNYLELPTESELNLFLESFNILKIKKNICGSEGNIVKSISFTAILEKK
jgi:SAM-dependent methyltransferase